MISGADCRCTENMGSHEHANIRTFQKTQLPVLKSYRYASIQFLALFGKGTKMKSNKKTFLTANFKIYRKASLR